MYINKSINIIRYAGYNKGQVGCDLYVPMLPLKQKAKVQQRYTKSPELPNNPGDFLRLLLSFIVTHVYFPLLAKHLYTVKICLFNWRESFHLIFTIFARL